MKKLINGGLEMQLTEENLLTLEFHKGYMAGDEDAIKDYRNHMDHYERLLNSYKRGYEQGYNDRRNRNNVMEDIIKESKK